jgi:flagellin-like protein
VGSLTDDRAVSEVVGALMLVAVVSSAAFGFGLFLHQQSIATQAQKAAVQAKALEQLAVRGVLPIDADQDGLWDRLDFTLVSGHLHNSTITAIRVNDQVVRQVRTDPAGPARLVSFDPSDVANATELELGPREQMVLRLENVHEDAVTPPDPDANFSFFAGAVPLPVDDSVRIDIVTSLGNLFSRAFIPPSAVLVIDQQGGLNASYVLDGALSDTANEGGFLVRYDWTVTPGAGDPDAAMGPFHYLGRRALASVICDDGECNGAQNYTVQLKVTDNFGMSGLATFAMRL